MLHELDQPTFIEVVEKASNVGVKHVVHFLLQERVRQRIQRIVLAAPRSKTIRETEKVFLVNLVEDSDHSLLDDFVLHSRDSQWTLPSILFLDVHSARWCRPIGSPMYPAMQISEPIFQSGFILLPGDSVHSWCRFSLQRVKAFPQQIGSHMVEQGSELSSLILLCCFPHARQSLGHAYPALCQVRVRLNDVLPRLCPSLPGLRRRSPSLVRLVHRYYSTVRLLQHVHVRLVSGRQHRRPYDRSQGRQLEGIHSLHSGWNGRNSCRYGLYRNQCQMVHQRIHLWKYAAGDHDER